MSDASIDVVVPDLGVSGPIFLVTWLVNRGDTLIPGERMAELLADGCLFHLESPVGGILATRLGVVGKTVSVGDTIARVLPSNENDPER